MQEGMYTFITTAPSKNAQATTLLDRKIDACQSGGFYRYKSHRRTCPNFRDGSGAEEVYKEYGKILSIRSGQGKWRVGILAP